MIQEIELGKLVPNKYNPRKRMTKKHLASLRKSMKEDGQLQTLLVRPIDGGKFEVVAGMRRFHVLSDLHPKNHKVPCTVREMDDEIAMMLAYKENMEREQLNPIDDAGWFFGMLGLKTEQLFVHDSGARKTIEEEKALPPERALPLPTKKNRDIIHLADVLNTSASLIEKRLPLLALPLELQDILILTSMDELKDTELPLGIEKAQAIARLRLIGDKDEAHKHMREIWRKWGSEDANFINDQVTKILDTFKESAEAVLRELETTEKNLDKRIGDLNKWIDKDISGWLNPKDKDSLFATFPSELSEDNGVQVPDVPAKMKGENVRGYAHRLYSEMDDFIMGITRSDTLEETKDSLDIRIRKLETGRKELEDHTCTYCGTEVKENAIRDRIESLSEGMKDLDAKIKEKVKVRDTTEKLRRELGLLIRRFDDISGDYLASLDKLLKTDKIDKNEYKARLSKYELGE